MSDPSENSTLIFKIATVADWNAAAGGAFKGSRDDVRDGFIHFSLAHQLQGTLAKHYCNRSDLVIAAFDASALAPELKWESSRGGDLFPHLYGVLDIRKALWVQPIAVDAAGAADLPNGIA